jgi:hypothetical protein
MTVPQIDNGKSPDEAYNATLGFWLPPDCPYGNLQLKLLSLSERLDEANRRLRESCMFWEQSRQNAHVPISALSRHQFTSEQAVSLIRRATDELIALIWCLFQRETSGQYPEEITVDRIGEVLEQSNEQRLPPFKNHEALFQQLNVIANAFKHSFVNSDQTAIGQDEPSVYALSLHRNRLATGVRFYGISLANLIAAFNDFYAESMTWLREFSERNR